MCLWETTFEVRNSELHLKFYFLNKWCYCSIRIVFQFYLILNYYVNMASSNTFKYTLNLTLYKNLNHIKKFDYSNNILCVLVNYITVLICTLFLFVEKVCFSWQPASHNISFTYYTVIQNKCAMNINLGCRYFILNYQTQHFI